jgi:hypothetical protein
MIASDLSEYVVMLLTHHRPKDKIAEEVATFLNEEESATFLTWWGTSWNMFSSAQGHFC